MPDIIKTADGSATLYVKELNETYHSRHGAIQESIYVFIKNGLEYFMQLHSKNKIKLLEIGFGTGLNALLTLNYSENYTLPKFFYHTIEAFPLDVSLIKKLNYTENTANLLLLHNAKWNKEQKISENFMLTKYHRKLEEFETHILFDIIYYDAFGPRAQAEMWTEKALLKAISYLSTHGILVTYCAKGEVKRIFKNAGFVVETLKGPPGKREMIRVFKKKF